MLSMEEVFCHLVSFLFLSQRKVLRQRKQNKASKGKFIAPALILEVKISYSDRTFALPEDVLLVRGF